MIYLPQVFPPKNLKHFEDLPYLAGEIFLQLSPLEVFLQMRLPELALRQPEEEEVLVENPAPVEVQRP